MSGFLSMGESESRRGAEAGRRANATASFDVEIRISDLVDSFGTRSTKRS
jgi:hypothetical protein